MRKLQIKTLEMLITDILHSSKDENLSSAFAYVQNHFSDEDYLYDTDHNSVISAIYLQNFYKYKKVKALSREMHLDTKTLLNYRKAYLRLLAKQYLNLFETTNADLALLYAALSNPDRNDAAQLEQDG
ncbi:MAG: hypothetical protein DBX59_09560 [Bacillota bacterium]|nr:MAG: hypothetical protein DBX59_09560 [Bacillota bacterium]